MGNMAEQGYGNPGPREMTQNEFFAEVDDLRNTIDTITNNIASIESLHGRALNDIDESQLQETDRRMEALSAETSQLNKATTDRIRILKTKAVRSGNTTFENQAKTQERNFKDALIKYREVEKTYADRTRAQMARQFRIVRPDATEEEVRQACEDGSGQQIFSQEVSKPLVCILGLKC